MANQQGPIANLNAATAAPPTAAPANAAPANAASANAAPVNAAPAIAPPAIAATAVPTPIAPGPDLRAPILANQVAPIPDVRRASTRNNGIDPTDYRHARSTSAHEVQIWDNPDPTKHHRGGLRAGLDFWLHLVLANGTIIEEHMVLQGITTISGVRHLQWDRIDGNHVQAWFGAYTAVGNLVKALAARCWTNVNLGNMRMKYEWWHVYQNANYTIHPENHGQYMGNLMEFRKNFCLRNGWTRE